MITLVIKTYYNSVVHHQALPDNMYYVFGDRCFVHVYLEIVFSLCVFDATSAENEITTTNGMNCIKRVNLRTPLTAFAPAAHSKLTTRP